MSTIDDKLNTVIGIKEDIRQAVNRLCNNTVIGIELPFTEYAQYIEANLEKRETVTYTVTFMNGSTEVGKIENIAPGTQSITTLSFSGTNTGYSNDGHWYEGNTQKCVFGGEYGPINSNKTLSVKWTANTYTVSYNIDEGSGTRPGNLSINYNQTKTLATYNGTKTDSQTGITYQANGWRKTYGTQKDYTNGGSYKQEDAHDIELTVIWQEVQPQETYYYKLDNGDNVTPENPIQTDFNTATSTTDTLTNLDVSNFDCVFVSAFVPNNIQKVEFQSEQLGQVVLDKLFDKTGTEYDSLITFDNIPQGYKALIFVVCGANGLENTKLKITR